MAFKKLPLYLAGSLLAALFIPFLLPTIRAKRSTLPIPPQPTPILTEICPRPKPDHPAWVEIFNPSSSRIVLAGYELRTLENQIVPLGAQVPELPGGDYLLVCFDAGPSNREMEPCPTADLTEHAQISFSDSWRPHKAQLTLLRRNPGGGPERGVVDSLAWGGPANAPETAAARNIDERVHDWVLLNESTGLYDPETEIQPGETIGLLPAGRSGNAGDWVVFTSDEATPGRGNRQPAPRFITPPTKSEIGHADAIVAWMSLPGDIEYRVQISPTDDFAQLECDLIWDADGGPFVKPAEIGIGTGRFFFRVCRDDCRADKPLWSRKMEYTFSEFEANSVVSTQLKGIRYAYQRKDTPLLCLRPCSSRLSYDCGCSDGWWDRPHPPDTSSEQYPPWICDFSVSAAWPARAPDWGPHGRNYCVRACISMIVTYYNRCLSQDRIAYQENLIKYDENPGLEDPNADFDLYHGATTATCGAADGGRCTDLLEWALGADTAPLSSVLLEAVSFAGVPVPDLIFTPDPPSFEAMEAALKLGRPLMSRWTGGGPPHMRVIDGCRRLADGTRLLRILDPLAGKPQWHAYHERPWRAATGTWACPPKAYQGWVKNDEASIWKDHDRDGIVDFDESERFDTSGNLRDSDLDRVGDKVDLQEYVFLPTPLASLPCPTPTCTVADYDGDGLRKEIDPDNDNDLCLDGWEDSNRNGLFDSGETTTNFDGTDCVPVLPECPY